MAQEFKLPELGEDIKKAVVTSILVKSGDTIEKDQGVVEVETDKATAEVPSTLAGKVKEIRVSEGDEIEVGQVVLTVDAGGAPEEGGEGKASGEKEPEEEKKKRRAGEGGNGAGAAEGGRSGKKEASGKGKAEKAPAGKQAGSTRSRAAEEKDDAGSGAGEEEARESGSDAKIDEDEEESRGRKRAAEGEEDREEAAAGEASGDGETAPVAAAPSVRRLARELGVNLRRIAGSGPGGRILDEDVKKRAREIISSRRGAGPAPEEGPALPDFSRWGDIRREPMSGIRRATAGHMATAWSQVPQVTQHDEADVRDLEAFRSSWNAGKKGGKQRLSMTAILVKASAVALKAFPEFNVSVDPQAGEIIHKTYIHVGVAVDTARGLLVPVIRDAGRKGILRIAAELEELASRARDGKLEMESMRGGTFTVTNLGGLGTTYFSPIVNWPEVAILGAGRAAARPAPGPAAGEDRLVMPLSLSYDHRAVDGAGAARFLRWIAEALEEPLKMALEG